VEVPLHKPTWNRHCLPENAFIGISLSLWNKFHSYLVIGCPTKIQFYIHFTKPPNWHHLHNLTPILCIRKITGILEIWLYLLYSFPLDYDSIRNLLDFTINHICQQFHDRGMCWYSELYRESPDQSMHGHFHSC